MIKSFSFEGKKQQVSFIETLTVNDHVVCDTYSFVGDNTKDLGIIRIQLGGKTPLQRVLTGDRTIEGYISGNGKLKIKRANNEEKIYEFGDKSQEPLMVNVYVGDLMQWQASLDSNLIVFEICFPPYKDGRYENIIEDSGHGQNDEEKR